MLWFLTLTQSCNLACKYCGSSENFDIEDLSPHPREISFDLNLLKRIQKDPDPVIAFYGGEPLLKMRLFKQIMELIPNAKYVLQTNAILLSKLKTEILHKFDCILISVDGDEKVTDYNRGEGTYQKVLENIRNIRERGFKGDLIARMTISEVSDIYTDVLHLISLGLFDHIHWQIDCLWDSEMTARWKDFYKWRDEIYNPGITKLAALFIEELRKGNVLPIVPFLGLLSSFIEGKKATLRCGAGRTSFNITTGGYVNACPVAPEFDPISKLDDDFDPNSVRDSVFIGGLCNDCEILDKCGGRCLYTNKNMWWGKKGFRAVCNTVKHLVAQMDEILPEVKDLAQKKVFDMDLMNYPKYNNTCEIIP
ncbi:radical sam domain containing protein [Anaeramoeba ignava]|uniref:Radical sam domain containing protein n=1 Tax=Anaeramoeba ignava TaxID=1746090 RepID=A0A9Q0R9P1_ANAIG|nr:radical sam domain containing protein [Anaeramoeba ignava]